MTTVDTGAPKAKDGIKDRVGEFDGAFDSTGVGDSLGTSEVSVVGLLVGDGKGATEEVGELEGIAVGPSVGDAIGASLGSSEGLLVGCSEGARERAHPTESLLE